VARDLVEAAIKQFANITESGDVLFPAGYRNYFQSVEVKEPAEVVGLLPQIPERIKPIPQDEGW
jgi:hypothetical protein